MTRRIRRTIIPLALLAFASPALGTENITCTSADNSAMIDLLVGTVPGLGLIRAIYESGNLHWSTEPSVVAGTLVNVSQSFTSDDTIMVDFVDEQWMDVVAQLRLYRAQGEGSWVMGGTLRIAGQGAWVVDCGEF